MKGLIETIQYVIWVIPTITTLGSYCHMDSINSPPLSSFKDNDIITI